MIVTASTNDGFLYSIYILKEPAGAELMPDLVKSKTGTEYLIIAKRRFTVVEPLLSGIVLGLIFVTLSGLFYAAYKQYKRPNELGG